MRLPIEVIRSINLCGWQGSEYDAARKIRFTEGTNLPTMGWAAANPNRSTALIHVPARALMVWRDGALVTIAAQWLCGGKTEVARLGPPPCPSSNPLTIWTQCRRCRALKECA